MILRDGLNPPRSFRFSFKTFEIAMVESTEGDDPAIGLTLSEIGRKLVPIAKHWYRSQTSAI